MYQLIVCDKAYLRQLSFIAHARSLYVNVPELAGVEATDLELIGRLQLPS